MMNEHWLFPQSIEQAILAQKEMAQKLSLEDAFESFPIVGGMDVSHTPFDPEEMIFAATVVLSNSKLIASATTAQRQSFPYITGLLGFREAPALISSWEQLQIKPDCLFIDGHGISHPRGLGIASHVGVLLDIPTIGVAKSILVGKPLTSLGEKVGSQTPLIWKEKEIAMMIRTKKNCNPLIISTGHKMSLKTAVDLVLSQLHGYKLPEPTRWAHNAANAARKEYVFS